MDQFCDKSIFESYMTQIYEKSFQDVFLNFFSLLLTIVFSFSVWGVFMILQPFLKPLIWALLFGSVLHPFKHMLTKKFIKWIDTMENTPVQLYLLQLVTTPLKLTLNFSIYFGDLIMKYAIALISIILGFLMVGLIYNYTPNFIYYLLYIILHNSITLFDTLLNICEKTSVVTAVVVVYVFSLQYLWSPQLNSTFYYLPSFVWLTLTGYISGYFGFFRLAMFMFFQLLYILGIIYNWWNSKKIEQHIVSNVTSNYTEDINNQKLLNLSSEACKDEKESKELKRNANMANTFLVEWPLNHLWQFASDNTSDIYIYWVAMACVTTIVLKSSWLLYIIVLLLSLYATRHLSAYFGVTVFFHKQYNTVLGYFKNWLISRKEAIFISPIKGIVTVCYVIKMQILELLKGSSDSAATVMVILGLLIFLIFSTTFLGIQACTEGVYMIKVGGNVINQTVVHNPGLKQLLPDNWEHKFDLALNNAYMYGREWLSTMGTSGSAWF
uniref:Uncharacterized protein n=1 Tax=Clastoptera arizonana TaxID=38151 RepID=A0A1B6DQP2_9HEMI